MEIKKICVLGAGLMGNGIAQICAQAGYEVALRDIEQRFVDGGMNTIKKNLARDVEKGKMTQAHMEAVLGRITPTLDLKQAAAGADVVVASSFAVAAVDAALTAGVPVIRPASQTARVRFPISSAPVRRAGTRPAERMLFTFLPRISRGLATRVAFESDIISSCYCI